MKYVFDTGPFVSLFANFYPSTFVTLWQRFNALIAQGKVVSTREVFREIEDQDDRLRQWAKDHKAVFTTPGAREGKFVARIYGVTHFQGNIEQRKLIQGGKNADPFVIAKAAVTGASVVTMEKFKPHATKIPNICDHFNVPCLSLEAFMQQEGWQF